MWHDMTETRRDAAWFSCSRSPVPSRYALGMAKTPRITREDMALATNVVSLTRGRASFVSCERSPFFLSHQRERDKRGGCIIGKRARESGACLASQSSYARQRWWNLAMVSGMKRETKRIGTPRLGQLRRGGGGGAREKDREEQRKRLHRSAINR